MATPRQILSIEKTDRPEVHDRISQIAGANPDSTPWTMNMPEAISAAESGEFRFYASVWGRAVWVVVATDAGGTKYLKAETDGLQPNNLLTIPARP